MQSFENKVREHVSGNSNIFEKPEYIDERL